MRKPHIAIVGRMNAGKSTLLNFLTDQQASIVSPIAGTTTDPVRRTFELLDFGAVVFVDTAGYDDRSELGPSRVKSTMAAIDESDLVLFVPLFGGQIDMVEREFLASLPVGKVVEVVEKPFSLDLLQRIKSSLQEELSKEVDFFGGRLVAGDTVVLVCPLDSQAPRGRLIMPQVAAIRAALDCGATSIVVQPAQLPMALEGRLVRLVVSDAQAYAQVRAIVAGSVELTSFSALLAQTRGDVGVYEQGLARVLSLRDGDRVLLIEHCSHEVNCEDIARVKIPKLLSSYVGVALSFTVVSGRTSLPVDLSSYSLAVQCGGCVASGGTILARIAQCSSCGVPITNYGMLLALVSASRVC
ncbi:MAG: GTPase [Mucinivorans sp.]